MNAIELSTVGHTGTNACGDCVRPQSNEAVIIETRSPTSIRGGSMSRPSLLG